MRAWFAKILVGAKRLFTRLFQKEIIAAIVLILGYMLNAHYQRRHELYTRKLEAYENVLTQIELLIGSKDEDYKRKLNSAFAVLTLTAPGEVIKRINDEVIVNKENIFDREDFRKLQLILHEDLHGKSKIIDDSFFPSFE